MNNITIPSFEQVVVDGPLKDGYWIEAVDVDGDGNPDLVASGLAIGDVVWYQNPGSDYGRATWEKHHIRQFPKPVALDHADIDHDGNIDLVVCYDYGNCMFNCGQNDGKISWLRNPGTFETAKDWETYPVADLVATHRLRLGYFTSHNRLELLAAPVVGPNGGPESVHQPARVMLYQVPEDMDGLTDGGWEGSVVNDSSFRVIHDVVSGKYTGALAESNQESLLFACEEGIVWLYYANKQWQTVYLGAGTPPNPDVIPEIRRFKGSGNLAVGRMGSDACAYIATLEPFHGNTVAVYTKSDGALTWKRTILDVFGDQDKQTGEGAGHHVVAADFDGDGNDEFLVALRGPMPWQGVFYYKAVDVKNGVFTKTRVSSASAARITVADFDGDGKLDFATTGYYTPGYFLADNPQILVFLNKICSDEATQ